MWRCGEGKSVRSSAPSRRCSYTPMSSFPSRGFAWLNVAITSMQGGAWRTSPTVHEDGADRNAALAQALLGLVYRRPQELVDHFAEAPVGFRLRLALNGARGAVRRGATSGRPSRRQILEPDSPPTPESLARLR